MAFLLKRLTFTLGPESEAGGRYSLVLKVNMIDGRFLVAAL